MAGDAGDAQTCAPLRVRACVRACVCARAFVRVAMARLRADRGPPAYAALSPRREGGREGGRGGQASPRAGGRGGGPHFFRSQRLLALTALDRAVFAAEVADGVAVVLVLLHQHLVALQVLPVPLPRRRQVIGRRAPAVRSAALLNASPLAARALTGLRNHRRGDASGGRAAADTTHSISALVTSSVADSHSPARREASSAASMARTPQLNQINCSVA